MSLISIFTPDQFSPKTANSQGVDHNVASIVSGIISEVIAGGDKTILDYTKKFDGVELKSLKIDPALIKEAQDKIDPETLEILQGSIDNVKAFHTKQMSASWQEQEADGTILGEVVTPLDRVGIYIPGGKAFYPSSMIMNAVPALLAGVKEVVAVTPPGPNGLPHELVLGLCWILGITEIYPIGGAQAVAALAYGTETIKPVVKITGPGNQWVAEAKRQVFGKVGIDSIAGPSEILILHDDLTVPTEYLVRDLLSQAEHDEEAASILVTTSMETAKAVQARLDEIVPSLPKTDIITASLKDHGAIVVVDSIEQGIEISNDVAPEHLEVLLMDESKMSLIRNAGAIFVGRWSSEPVGDYYAGPNHTIPTSGAARYAAPLSTRDFQKHSSYIKYSETRLRAQGEKIARFADLEELNAHATAIRTRLES